MDEYLDIMDQIAAERILQSLRLQKKPKFKVNRVPEELRSVPVYLDFEHDEFIFRDSFIWNLNDYHISPLEFVEQLVQKVGFGNAKQMHQQLLFQIMEYIEKHSVHMPEDVSQTQKKQQSEKKKQTNAQQRSSRTQIPRQNYGANKKCVYCEFVNQSGVYCKKCRIPFVVLDNVNPSEPIIKACFLFYEVVINRAPLIEPRRLIKEDFSSLYQLKNKLIELCGEQEDIDEIFQEFMKNRDNLDQEDFISSLKAPKPKKKEETQSSQEESEEESEEEQDSKQQSKQSKQSKVSKISKGSKISKESSEASQSSSPKKRMSTRMKTRGEMLRRSVRKRK